MLPYKQRVIQLTSDPTHVSRAGNVFMKSEEVMTLIQHK